MEEIEAKLLVRSADMQRIESELVSLQSVGPYVLREPSEPVVSIRDTYYDTPEGHLHRQGVSLRVREEDAVSKITLKARHSQEGSLHVREEVEEGLEAKATASILVLLADRDLIARDRVDSAVAGAGDDPLAALGLCGLSPVAAVGNRRHLREILAGGVLVAHLCVDNLCLSHAGRSERQVEIEIEADSPSGRDDVERLADGLRRMYPGAFLSAKLSKLDRALRIRRDPQTG